MTAKKVGQGAGQLCKFELQNLIATMDLSKAAEYQHFSRGNLTIIGGGGGGLAASPLWFSSWQGYTASMQQ